MSKHSTEGKNSAKEPAADSESPAGDAPAGLKTKDLAPTAGKQGEKGPFSCSAVCSVGRVSLSAYKVTKILLDYRSGPTGIQYPQGRLLSSNIEGLYAAIQERRSLPRF